MNPEDTPRPTAGRILVVDDNATNRSMLAEHVSHLGHIAVTAENGRQALERLREESFDLVLMDVLMPEMSGFEALRQMRADQRLRRIPVIMISGLDELASVVQGIEEGAEDYLSKPFDPVLLRARIGATLEKKRLRDAERRRAEALEQALQQLKAAQDRLVVQQKMASLGALTAGIAHEIRNPLNFVTNFAQLAVELVDELRSALAGQAGRLDPSAATEVEDLLGHLEQNVGKIHEHGRRADTIVRGMLLHSRGQGGERMRTDLNALIGEYVSLAYHGLRGQDATFQVILETDLDRTLPPVEVSPQELARVILNLAHNAFYAAHQKRRLAGSTFSPRVEVRTRSLPDAVEIRVRDNGDGIPKDSLEQIFTPFFTTKPAGAGTGLGLSISYDIVVQMHKGNLRVESEEGSFAEFIVTLPKSDEPMTR
jgi:two-component system NtrC family sensor kinase